MVLHSVHICADFLRNGFLFLLMFFLFWEEISPKSASICMHPVGHFDSAPLHAVARAYCCCSARKARVISNRISAQKASHLSTVLWLSLNAFPGSFLMGMGFSHTPTPQPIGPICPCEPRLPDLFGPDLNSF